MSQFPYEIPNEFRELATKSVDQTRKAFEGFFGAAQKAVDSVDTSAFPAATGAKDVGSKTISYAETNVKAALDYAQKVVQAKDLQEVLNLQSEYLKSQVNAFQEQAKELGTTVQKAVTPKAS